MEKPNQHDKFDDSKLYPKPGEEGCTCIVLDPKPNQNAGGGNDVSVAPGFEKVIANQQRQENDSNPLKVSQMFSAVIDGEFDGGYYISVKTGNSDTSLRGVVFKPDSCVTVPTLGNNDVVEGVPLIPRNVVTPLAQVQRNKEQNIMSNTNETVRRNESPSGATSSDKPSASSAKNVPSVADKTTELLLTRGKVVPVEFKPVNLPTREPHSHQEKGKSISGDISIEDLNRRPSPAVELMMNPPQPCQGRNQDMLDETMDFDFSSFEDIVFDDIWSD